MQDASYLCYLDKNPPQQTLIDYLAQYSIKVKQIKKLPEKLDKDCAALVIHLDYFGTNVQTQLKTLQQSSIPVIVISDEANENGCITALEGGADDFLIKSVTPREFHARLNAISRRIAKRQARQEKQKEILLFGDWQIHTASRQVFDPQHQEVILSPGEYELLQAFVNRPHQVLDREFLLKVTHNDELSPFDRRIDVQISRLRQKIEQDPQKPLLIKTIRNGGYLFTARVVHLKENELE